ncbi:hypothetical protein [Flavobacterium sp. 120]|uniref:hypothetical protein n=1 Tax=Flavobacterium sp. 120 TaxID=2135626 RepID=UPI000EB55B66|nr:hypothetical protein [Flavobacterium sp. 120]RKS14904.1 hypothetical protein C8C87_2208 [Flavobacterium sp. 120]
MKQILFFIIISIGISSKSYSQIEFSKKFKAIPLKNNAPKIKKVVPPETEIPPIYTPNVFKSPEIKTPSSVLKIGEANTINMTPKNDFANPGDVYMDKMEKDLDKTLVKEGLKEDSRLLVKIDVNFGEIRTKSKYFVIKFRDFGQIDGDLARASLNGAVIEDRLVMKENFQEFKIFFIEGINTFVIEALNKGLLGGNTAEFQIYDAEGKFIKSDYWANWDAGVKGKFLIIKE